MASSDDHAARPERTETGAPPPVGTRNVSLPALRLHAQGLLASFEAGNAGFVSDAYLTTLGRDVAVSVVELCVAGVWQRTNNGYRVISSEALRMVGEVERQTRDRPDAGD